jgi:hypothetical protein
MPGVHILRRHGSGELFCDGVAIFKEELCITVTGGFRALSVNPVVSKMIAKTGTKNRFIKPSLPNSVMKFSE